MPETEPRAHLEKPPRRAIAYIAAAGALFLASIGVSRAVSGEANCFHEDDKTVDIAACTENIVGVNPLEALGGEFIGENTR